MGSLVIILGSLLSLLGATVIKLGLDVAARDDRGWTQVISGSVAFSAGFITVALGLVLMRLGGIRRDLARLATTQMPVSPASNHLRQGAEAGESTMASALREHGAADLPRAATGAGAAALAGAYPGQLASYPAATDHAESDHDLGAGATEMWDHARHAAGSRNDPTRATQAADHANMAHAENTAAHSPAAAWTEPHGTAHVDETVPAGPLDNAGHVHASDPQTSAAAPAASAHPTDRAKMSAVVGQYEANGVAYVMYADGSIDADTVDGVYHFDNIAELKRFIEERAFAPHQSA